jgi:predicted dehydrogenase
MEFIKELMKQVKIGVIGLGNMGSLHARNILDNKIKGMELEAVADILPERLKPFEQVACFPTAKKLIASGRIDAVLIATPHYSHTTIGIMALKAGLHVMVEKPISVHKADCLKLIAAHKNKRQLFAAMFQQRTDPVLCKIRAMVKGGQLGEIRRFNWIVTNWFRTQAYYASGDWRATWAGEGGGVLLNQCPHNLDQIFWIFGQPKSIRAHCQFGRYHDIEVEDDVTAYLQYANGASGVLVTTTGESPGTNRLEITGEKGKLVWEGNRLLFEKNLVPMSQFSSGTKESFGRPPTRQIEVKAGLGRGSHNAILQNFADAIIKGKPLIAKAEEGINSVELANAMLLSSFRDKTILLPLNAREYADELRKKIEGSRFVKKTVKHQNATNDFSQSFQR